MHQEERKMHFTYIHSVNLHQDIAHPLWKLQTQPVKPVFDSTWNIKELRRQVYLSWRWHHWFVLVIMRLTLNTSSTNFFVSPGCYMYSTCQQSCFWQFHLYYSWVYSNPCFSQVQATNGKFPRLLFVPLGLPVYHGFFPRNKWNLLPKACSHTARYSQTSISIS